MVKFLPQAPCLTECVVYVPVHRDISNLKDYPLHPHEVFRAKIADSAGEYHSLSGFRAPCDQIVEIVNAFLASVGERSRAMVVEQFVDPLGFHPIP